MLDLKNKLELGFKTINPNISTQKAFELLADPKVSTLIYMGKEGNTFYYLTEHEIKQSIRKHNEISKRSVFEIAIKSLIFDYNQYIKNNIKYLIEFKRSLSNLFNLVPEKFLVKSNGEPLGLVSDIVFTDLPDTMPEEFKSLLDEFIDSVDDPHESLENLYNNISSLGFKLTPEVKSHIKLILANNLDEREKNKELSATGVKPELVFRGKNQVPVDSRSGTPDTTSKGLVVIYNPSHIGHRPVGSSPEMPERLIKIMDILKRREKVFNDRCRLISDYPPASETDLLRVHTRDYINFIKNYASKGGGFLGDSTYITKSTHDLALLAVGGAIRTAKEVIECNMEFGLGLIRPPGHHASRDKYGGYCIYNNAAVLARYLQAKFGFQKILILDWDAHAANGTMDIFYDDPSVMLISLHQDPHTFYPKTGFISQMGKSNGVGYTVNMEMPRGSGDDEYLSVFDELVLPLYQNFKPDFVIGCNGFDTHHSDQFTDLQLTSHGYYKFCTYFRKYMINKMVILMEGGYNPYMGELTHTLINGLLGKPNPFNDPHLSLIQKVVSDEKIQIILNKKLKELKYNLRRNNVL